METRFLLCASLICKMLPFVGQGFCFVCLCFGLLFFHNKLRCSHRFWGLLMSFPHLFHALGNDSVLCIGLTWQGFGSSVATRVATVRRIQKLPWDKGQFQMAPKGPTIDPRADLWKSKKLLCDSSWESGVRTRPGDTKVHAEGGLKVL